MIDLIFQLRSLATHLVHNIVKSPARERELFTNLLQILTKPLKYSAFKISHCLETATVVQILGKERNCYSEHVGLNHIIIHNRQGWHLCS